MEKRGELKPILGQDRGSVALVVGTHEAAAGRVVKRGNGWVIHGADSTSR